MRALQVRPRHACQPWSIRRGLFDETTWPRLPRTTDSLEFRAAALGRPARVAMSSGRHASLNVWPAIGGHDDTQQSAILACRRLEEVNDDRE